MRLINIAGLICNHCIDLHRRYRSFTMYQQGWKLDELNGRIRICKKWYKYFQSRNIEGKVKTVTVKRDGVSALGGEPLSAARFTTSIDSAGTVQ